MSGQKRLRLRALILLLCLLPGLTLADEAEEVLARLSLREKVGQLFWVRPEQISRDESGAQAGGGRQVTDRIRAGYGIWPVGGFVLFGGNISGKSQLMRLTADLKGLGAVRPAIAVDEEGGGVRRLGKTGALKLPLVRSMSVIGRTGSPAIAYDAGYTIGAYLSEYGVTMNLAPVADTLVNPKNQVVRYRSFGSDPDLVSQMVSNYITGLHEWGVAACVKHFPGHGGTIGDSHGGTVVLSRTWEELLACELIPFRDQFGLTEAVMVGHISLPKVTDDGLPASLSRRLITERLREELGYQGLVMSDALEMKAVTARFSPGEAAVLAFQAGNDVLLMPERLPEAFEAVLLAVESGHVSEERLDESVLRILRFKQRFGGL